MITITDKKLGKRLRQARLHRGLSQTAAVESLPFNRATLSYIETGGRHVRVSDLLEFVALYKRPIAYFLGDDNVMSDDLAELLQVASELSEGDRVMVKRFAQSLRDQPDTSAA